MFPAVFPDLGQSRVEFGAKEPPHSASMIERLLPADVLKLLKAPPGEFDFHLFLFRALFQIDVRHSRSYGRPCLTRLKAVLIP